jgi:hypothetical protein
MEIETKSDSYGGTLYRVRPDPARRQLSLGWFTSEEAAVAAYNEAQTN